jgi:hypothetical protein
MKLDKENPSHPTKETGEECKKKRQNCCAGKNVPTGDQKNFQCQGQSELQESKHEKKNGNRDLQHLRVTRKLHGKNEILCMCLKEN